MKPQERVGIRTLSTHLAARQGFERVLSIWGLKRTRFSVYTAPPPGLLFHSRCLGVTWGLGDRGWAQQGWAQVSFHPNLFLLGMNAFQVSFASPPLTSYWSQETAQLNPRQGVGCPVLLAGGRGNKYLLNDHLTGYILLVGFPPYEYHMINHPAV